MQTRFKELSARGEGALIGHLVVGTPDLARSREYVQALLTGGIDAVELSIPFSDPIADGPVLQDAHQRALNAGITPLAVFELVKELRRETSIPIVLTTYYNPVLARGEEAFLKLSLETGIDGVLVLDLPVEEAASFIAHARRYRVDTIFLATPETPEERLKAMATETTGFLCLSFLQGMDLHNGLEASLKRVRALVPSELPLVVRFEGSNPTELHALVRAGAQGVIVRNEFAERVAAGISTEQLREFVRELRVSLHATSPIAPPASVNEAPHLR